MQPITCLLRLLTHANFLLLFLQISPISDHPNVVRLEEVYESPTAIYLVQELCLGGDLFDRLDAQDDVHYTEAGCARLMKQIVDAIRYIHDKGIIHRDLKLGKYQIVPMYTTNRAVHMHVSDHIVCLLRCQFFSNRLYPWHYREFHVLK